MATEILINDGGAPARILPYTASVALTAGEAVCINGDSELIAATTSVAISKFAYVGILLTDVAAGAIGSVITGVGVILNIECDVTGVAGTAMMMGTTAGLATSAAGRLTIATNAAAAAKAQAYTLEAAPGAGGLTKCQTI